MKKYYDIKTFKDEDINIVITRNGYGKTYYEYKKLKNKILDEIYKDILDLGLTYDKEYKLVISRVLTIINKHYFK